MKHPILMLYGENNNNMGKIVPQCMHQYFNGQLSDFSSQWQYLAIGIPDSWILS